MVIWISGDRSIFGKPSGVLILLFAIGAVVRILIWSCFSGQPLDIFDERELYHPLAVSLLERHEFSFEPGEPICSRPPLYPLFVAVIYAISGTGNYQAVRMVQLVLSLLTGLLVYRISGKVFGNKTAVWATVLYLLYPSLLCFENLLLSESLFTFLLVLSLWSLMRLLESGSLGYAFSSGIFLGLGALTRTILSLFPIVLIPFLAIVLQGSLRRRTVSIGVLLIAFAGTLLPWSIRCSRDEGTFILVDCSSGRNFMMGNYEHTPMWYAWKAIGIKGKDSWHGVLSETSPDYRPGSQGQRDRLAAMYGFRFMWNHPFLTIKRDLVKFFDFWQLERVIVAGAHQGYFGVRAAFVENSLAIVICGSYAVAAVLAIFGIVLSRPENPRAHFLQLLLIGFVWSMHTLAFAHSRYHLPLMPIVLGYSANVIVHCRTLWQNRVKAVVFLAALSNLVLMASWLLRFIADIRMLSGNG